MSKSLQEKIDNIRRAGYDKLVSKPVCDDVWVRDVLEDAVIVQVGEETYRVGYSEASDGEVTFADRDKWQKVELTYVDVKESKPYDLDGDKLKVYRTGLALGPFGELFEREQITH